MKTIISVLALIFVEACSQQTHLSQSTSNELEVQKDALTTSETSENSTQEEKLCNSFVQEENACYPEPLVCDSKESK